MVDVSRVIGRTVAAAENRSPVQRYGLAIVLTLLAAAVNYAAFGFQRPYFPPFGLAVVLVSLYGGTRPGLLAVAIALISNFVLLPPRPSLLVHGGDNLAQIVFFGFVGQRTQRCPPYRLSERIHLSALLFSRDSLPHAQSASRRTTSTIRPMNRIAERMVFC